MGGRKTYRKKKKDGGKKRRQYLLAVILFVVIYAVFFGADLKDAVQKGIQAHDAVQSDNVGRLWELVTGGTDKEPVTGGNGDKLSVHFLDIGQGDATLIMCGTHAMLVDGGGNSKGTLVQSYLQSQHITKLDYVIGTHPDADHIGGIDVVLTKFACDMLLMPDCVKDTRTYEDVIAAAGCKDLAVTNPKAGDTYPLGDAAFTILGPLDDYENANDDSVCFLLSHGENSFLFTGDAEEDAEEDMLAAGEELSADVYKVAHHGSRTATTERFLRAVDPDYAVISCGDDNSYGHPHAEVLNRLRGAGVKLFRTDEQGTIVIDSDAKKLTFNCSPTESWQAGE